jgi:hypothetical protein
MQFASWLASDSASHQPIAEAIVFRDGVGPKRFRAEATDLIARRGNEKEIPMKGLSTRPDVGSHSPRVKARPRLLQIILA